jgi:hypothetical protein
MYTYCIFSGEDWPGFDSIPIAFRRDSIQESPEEYIYFYTRQVRGVHDGKQISSIVRDGFRDLLRRLFGLLWQKGRLDYGFAFLKISALADNIGQDSFERFGARSQLDGARISFRRSLFLRV